MKKNGLISIIAFVSGLTSIVLPPVCVVLGLVLAIVGIVLGSTGIVMADPGKSPEKTFAKIGLGLGILMLLVCIGRLQDGNDASDSHSQASKVDSLQPKAEQSADDIQKARADLEKAKADLKRAWGDVKNEFQKGFNGEGRPQSGDSSNTMVGHDKADGKPDISGVTVGDVVKEALSSALTGERRSQVNNVVEATNLFLTDEQKSNLAAIKTNATGMIKTIDDSMTEKDKRDLMKLKKGMESVKKLYKEVMEY